MWFHFARQDNYPTHYSDKFTSAHVEILISGFIFAFLIVGISLLITLPAYHNKKRFYIFLRIFISLFIGGAIIGGNFGPEFETGKLRFKSPYKPGSSEEVEGYLGLYIGLRGFNITLTGKLLDDDEIHLNDKNHPSSSSGIDFNEHFSWEWAQGRFGFGYYAGRVSRDYRSAVLRGVPLPILYLAEYFTFDGEGIRFGRYYRNAGYFSHILMWTAFAFWLISNILFFIAVQSGAFFLLLTGVLQLISIGIWTRSRNSIELKVPFEIPVNETNSSFQNDIGILETHFGFDYYLVIFNGSLSIFLSVVLMIFDSLNPDFMCSFFGIDPLTTFEERHLSKDEYNKEKLKHDDDNFKTILINEPLDDVHYEKPPSAHSSFSYGSMVDSHGGSLESLVVLKRKSTFLKNSFKHKPKIRSRKLFKSKQKDENSSFKEDEEERGIMIPMLRANKVMESDYANIESLPILPNDYKNPPPRPPKKYLTLN